MTRRTAVPALGALLFLAAPAHATHTTYSYTVSEFHLSGDQGTFDDAFDDNALAPWATLFGAPEDSAVDSGSGLVLSDPGLDFSLTSPFWSNTEMREASGASIDLLLADGGGDFLMESRWTSGPPLPDQIFGMGLQLPPFRNLNLNLMNLSAGLGASATHPLAAGLYIWFQDATLVTVFPDLVLSLDANPTLTDHLIPVTDTITGDIVLRLNFIDSDDVLIGSFSVDGGTTFYASEVLNTHGLDAGWASGRATLVADPVQVVPEPSTGALAAAGLAALAVGRRAARAG